VDSNFESTASLLNIIFPVVILTDENEEMFIPSGPTSAERKQSADSGFEPAASLLSVASDTPTSTLPVNCAFYRMACPDHDSITDFPAPVERYIQPAYIPERDDSVTDHQGLAKRIRKSISSKMAACSKLGRRMRKRVSKTMSSVRDYVVCC
jgi:hypothetical protein